MEKKDKKKREKCVRVYTREMQKPAADNEKCSDSERERGRQAFDSRLAESFFVFSARSRGY